MALIVNCCHVLQTVGAGKVALALAEFILRLTVSQEWPIQRRVPVNYKRVDQFLILRIEWYLHRYYSIDVIGMYTVCIKFEKSVHV
jgi:hypothetical protein